MATQTLVIASKRDGATQTPVIRRIIQGVQVKPETVSVAAVARPQVKSQEIVVHPETCSTGVGVATEPYPSDEALVCDEDSASDPDNEPPSKDPAETLFHLQQAVLVNFLLISQGSRIFLLLFFF